MREIELNSREELILEKLLELKKRSGSHSPSVNSLLEKIPEIKFKVDACFLSNPYATQLFLDYFEKEVLKGNKIREMLEYYPSQNNVIAEKLASFIGVDVENVFIGNGAIEIIQAIIHNFTKSKIIINIPTFSSYYEFVKPEVEVVYNKLLKKNDFNLDVESYIELIKKEKPDTIVLINPNNPNGGYLKGEQMFKIMKAARDVENVIVDESFIHFAYENSNYDFVSVTEFISNFPNLIIIKSMSKDFGIAGIRAGYAVMSKERSKLLLENGYLWNSNGLAEYFFKLYTQAKFAYNYQKVRIKYIIETNEFIKQIKQIKEIKVYPTMANFLLIELPEKVDLDRFTLMLLIRYGIYVRNANDKIGLEGNFIRVASRSYEENKYMIKVFKKIFN